MSLQSDAAKKQIEELLEETYPNSVVACIPPNWVKEYQFAKPRRWAFDYAVPAILCAIEIDGGTFQSTRTGHSSGVGLRAWREKHNEAMRRGWKVFHYAPEEIIKAGRKIGERSNLSKAQMNLNQEPYMRNLQFANSDASMRNPTR